MHKDTLKQRMDIWRKGYLFLRTGQPFTTRYCVLSLIPFRKGTCSFAFPVSLRTCTFCGKGYSYPSLLNPQASAGQHIRTRTAAEKRLHSELSSGWFTLLPQQTICVELKHPASSCAPETYAGWNWKARDRIVRAVKNMKRKRFCFTGQHRANIRHKSAENMQD